MQPSTITWTVDHNHRYVNYPNSGTGNDQFPVPKDTRRFFYSGFGSNPGTRFVDATPGEYTKIIRNETYGLFGWYNRMVYEPNKATGQMTGYSLSTGVCSAAPSYAATYVHAKPDFDSTTYNKALTKLWDDLNESDLNLALSIAEFRETKKMVDGIRKSIYDLLVIARRAKRDFLRNPSKKLSEIWLSYKYGWGPIIQDIYNLSQYTGKWFDGVTVKASARRKENITDVFTGSFLGMSGGWENRVTGRREWKAKVQMTVRLANMSDFDRSRLTSMNPASIAWELVPLSFVVDWVYNVGGYLESLEAALGRNGLQFVRGFATDIALVEVTEVSKPRGETIDSGVVYREIEHIWHGEAYAFRVEKRRTKLTAMPLPRAPRLEVKLGLSRVTSAITLFRTILIGNAADDPKPRRKPRKK